MGIESRGSHATRPVLPRRQQGGHSGWELSTVAAGPTNPVLTYQDRDSRWLSYSGIPTAPLSTLRLHSLIERQRAAFPLARHGAPDQRRIENIGFIRVSRRPICPLQQPNRTSCRPLATCNK